VPLAWSTSRVKWLLLVREAPPFSEIGTCWLGVNRLQIQTAMQYHIRLMQSEEGWAVSCPALPGCHSQGVTRQEAVDNIRIAIREWLDVEAEESGLQAVEEDVVTV